MRVYTGNQTFRVKGSGFRASEHGTWKLQLGMNDFILLLSPPSPG